MAFDGAFLYCLANEINQAAGSHIDKIHQPSKEELVISLRKKGFNEKLLLSVKGGMSRLQFTCLSFENPETPPTFCALMRKHFSGAYFVGTKMHGLERVCDLVFSGTNEMGDRVDLKIVCEFIGSLSNVVLINGEGKIIDALHRTDLSSDRIIVPGAVYEYPKSQGKFDITEYSADILAKEVLKCGGLLSNALLNTLSGLSPLICREISYLSYGDDTETENITDIKPLEDTLQSFKEGLTNFGRPTIIYDQNGKPKDFTFTEVKQYGKTYSCMPTDTYGELLDTFYQEKERTFLINKTGKDVNKLVKTLLSRALRRKAVRENDLKATENREELRICGELLKANLHTFKSGDGFVTVQNFYDSELKDKTIKLDTALSPQQNAAKYFKEYKKACGARQSLFDLIESDNAEIEYLKTVADNLSRAENLTDINEIRAELISAGLIKQKKQTVRKKKPTFTGLKFKADEGFDIYVGKNNIQNDYVTTVIGKKGDIWLHTKNIHGSHVVIKCEGKPCSEETLLFAARLAAKYSAAAHSSSVPVDYTDIKNVKKPSGAKPGFVIYKTNKTLFVKPMEEI